MPFRTKLDYSDNRQIKQRVRTNTTLSGATVFGVSFSALTTGPDLSNQTTTETVTSVLSTFSGNSATTVFTWYDNRMELGATEISAITPSNSGITQNVAPIYTANTTTVIDGNSVTLTYTGVSFDLQVTAMLDSGGSYTGTVEHDSVSFLSATTLDFTGRTIWIDNKEIIRTKKLIVTENPQIGYALTCIDSEGKVGFQPISGGTFTGNTSATCINDLYITNLYGCSPITIHDNIQFNSSSATGTSSTALGFQTIAGGDFGAFSQNYLTNASGDASHAEGFSTLASGDASHAEGGETIASGAFSHAEGSNSRASGAASHAEGILTIANGIYSHAEGNNTKASGDTSHAEGNSTTAMGVASHSEGINTMASGDYSHAEGNNTTASGDTSHAEGKDTLSNGIASHSEGINTTASGDYSHAEGNNTTASGENSHAEGKDTIASGNTSHAEGALTIAGGNFSHSEGSSNKALGQNSHAEGNGTIASGFYSHSEGRNTNATGTTSHAEGNETIAGGENSHSEGNQTTASGTNSHAQGDRTIASVDSAHAEGKLTTASGAASHAEGRNTKAIGADSHAQNNNTIASGTYSHAGGVSVVASGQTSFVHFIASGGTYGVYGNQSAILGGINNNINSGAHSSVILGGLNNVVDTNIQRSIVLGGQSITAVTNDTVYVPDLVIDGLINVADLQTNGEGLIIDGASDIKLKKNINNINDALNTILKLNPISFNWKKEINLRKGTVFGLIAQEVKKVIPEIVRKRAKGNGTLTIEYKELIPWIIAAIKELSNNSIALTKNKELILETQTIAAEDNNIELNFNGTKQTALNGGITIVKGIDNNTNSEFIINSDGNWITNNHIIPKGLIIPTFTPTSTNDKSGNLGEITRDDNYIYIKGNNGWGRSPLETF